jgi:hypothetical protein
MPQDTQVLPEPCRPMLASWAAKLVTLAASVRWVQLIARGERAIVSHWPTATAMPFGEAAIEDWMLGSRKAFDQPSRWVLYSLVSILPDTSVDRKSILSTVWAWALPPQRASWVSAKCGPGQGDGAQTGWQS